MVNVQSCKHKAFAHLLWAAVQIVSPLCQAAPTLAADPAFYSIDELAHELPRQSNGGGNIAENYFYWIGRQFRAAIPESRRFRFFVTDTLNASLWPLGNGGMVVHGGWLAAVESHENALFLVALDLAHDTLGHASLGSGAPELWRKVMGPPPVPTIELGGFGVAVDESPTENFGRGLRTYSVAEEREALKLVTKFCLRWRIPFDRTKRVAWRGVQGLRERFDYEGGGRFSSYLRMHAHLGEALQMTAPPEEPLEFAAALQGGVNAVSPLLYAQAVQEGQSSALQTLRWVIERSGENYWRAHRLDHHKKWAELKKVADDGLSALGPSTSPSTAQTSAESSAQAFIYKYFQLRALQGLGRFSECRRAATNGAVVAEGVAVANGEAGMAVGDTSWPAAFDSVRELMQIECEFMDGRLTEAGGLAKNLALRRPHLFEARLWEGLLRARLRELAQAQLGEWTARWGDRPGMRALTIFADGARGHWNAAKTEMEWQSSQLFPLSEFGWFAFAKAWYFASSDVRADSTRAQIEQTDATRALPYGRFLPTMFPALR